MITRRGFLSGVAGLIVAPAIVRVSSLMPVRMPIVTVVPQLAPEPEMTAEQMMNQILNEIAKMMSIPRYYLTGEGLESSFGYPVRLLNSYAPLDKGGGT